MRFEVVNEQFGFIGKVSERPKMEKAIRLLLEEINSLGCIEDSECAEVLEISYAYDVDEYKVNDIKSIWRSIKSVI
ncbi:hypothetical protein NVP1121O_139 [Vibrio phage 1.121.O._10N.286.46.C4]|nr:hypothetical protein NVP1121O_139 [Vibrio phage 1.121.O._10N.286.46.C4]